MALAQRLTTRLALMADAQNDTSDKRWLRPGERGGERVAIVSYPRCGNSLMRGLLESVTGVFTGCDTRPDRSLSQELQQYGLKGEASGRRAWRKRTSWSLTSRL